MRTAAVVLARARSTRLPGKMFLPFGDHTVLDQVIERVRACDQVHELVLATSTHPDDDAFEEVVARQQIQWVRGSEEDVIGRMEKAVDALSQPPDLVARICADNPLLMPEVIDSAVTELVSAQADLITPFELNTHPFGYGAVVLTHACLRRLSEEATEPIHREHVENYCFDHPARFHIHYQLADPGPEARGLGLTLDYAEDYARLMQARDAIAAVPLGRQAQALRHWLSTQPELDLEPVEVQRDGSRWALCPRSAGGPLQPPLFIDGRLRDPAETAEAFLQRVQERVRAGHRLAPHRPALGPSFSEASLDKRGRNTQRLGFSSSAAAFFPPNIQISLQGDRPALLEKILEQARFEPLQSLLCLNASDSLLQRAQDVLGPNRVRSIAEPSGGTDSLEAGFTTLCVSPDGRQSVPGLSIEGRLDSESIAAFWGSERLLRARVQALNERGCRQ